MSREGKYNISTFFMTMKNSKLLILTDLTQITTRIFKFIESSIHPSKEDVLLVEWAISDNSDYIYTGQVGEY